MNIYYSILLVLLSPSMNWSRVKLPSWSSSYCLKMSKTRDLLSWSQWLNWKKTQQNTINEFEFKKTFYENHHSLSFSILQSWSSRLASSGWCNLISLGSCAYAQETPATGVANVSRDEHARDFCLAWTSVHDWSQVDLAEHCVEFLFCPMVVFYLVFRVSLRRETPRQAVFVSMSSWFGHTLVVLLRACLGIPDANKR